MKNLFNNLKFGKGFTQPRFLGRAPKNGAGFTLLFTVLIVSIVLAIALGISRVSYTELVLSSVSREGARAFFAADTGLECGLYQDLENNVFIPPTSGAFECAGVSSYSAIAETTDPTTGYQRFQFKLELPDNACAYVNVYKNIPIDQDTYTRVEAFGYNRDCQTVIDTQNGTGAQDPNLVERALYAQYKNSLQLGGGGNPPNQNPNAQGQGQGSPS